MLLEQFKKGKFNLVGSFYKFQRGPANFIQVPELQWKTDKTLSLTITNTPKEGRRATFTELYKQWKETDNSIYLEIMSNRVLLGDFD